MGLNVRVAMVESIIDDADDDALAAVIVPDICGVDVLAGHTTGLAGVLKVPLGAELGVVGIGTRSLFLQDQRRE